MEKFCDFFTLRPSDLFTIDLRSYGQHLSLFINFSPFKFLNIIISKYICIKKALKKKNYVFFNGVINAF